MLLDNQNCRVVIDERQGGRVRSVTVHGWELVQADGVDTFHWGNFVIAPWAGRLRDGVFSWDGRDHHFPRNASAHALHGLVTDRVWEVVGPGTVAVQLADPWPWSGRVVHEVVMQPDGVDFLLRLEADEPMPAAMGWHPWFPRELVGDGGRTAGPVELDVSPGQMYANDAVGLPTGELVTPTAGPWDRCFRDLAGPPRLRWPGALELVVDSTCRDWVIYTEEPQAIAVEPWSAPPNSLNLPDPTVVTPGSPLTAQMSWRWTRLAPTPGDGS